MSHHTERETTIHRVRPRFQVESPQSPDDFLATIRQGLERPDASCQGKVYPTFATLYLPPQEQHYWSPQLQVSVEVEEGRTLIRGLYGPRPAVWTMFVFFYAFIGFATLVVTIIGMSYLSLNKPASILWLVPLLMLLFLSLYLVAFFGKKRGRNQMETLHRFIEEVTGLSFEEEG